jgi:DnaJ-domain-containing protein 1
MQDPLAEYEKARQTIEQAVSRVMIAMMVADGEIDDNEKTVVYEIFQELSGSELADEKFELEKEVVASESFVLRDYLASIAPELNDDAKKEVLRGAFMVAAADNVFHESERASLKDMGEALGIESTQLQEFLSIMENKDVDKEDSDQTQEEP